MCALLDEVDEVGDSSPPPPNRVCVVVKCESLEWSIGSLPLDGLVGGRILLAFRAFEW